MLIKMEPVVLGFIYAIIRYPMQSQLQLSYAHELQNEKKPRKTFTGSFKKQFVFI